MLSRLALLPLLACAVNAQNYTEELVTTLSNLGLTQLSGALALANTAPPGRALINMLGDTSKNFTVFAPNDAGWRGAFPNATTNAEDPGLLGTLAYHVVSGSFNNATRTYPNTTIGRTMLNASDLVMLEGNKSQVLAWSLWPSDNKVHILNQNTNVTVVNTTTFRNLQVNIVDAVIDTPGNLSNALDFHNLTTLEQVLRGVQTTYEGQSVTLFELLNLHAHGFTLFAPSDAAFAAAGGSLANLQSNTTALMAVLGNHLVNGSTVYSPSFAERNVTSASGQLISASSNGTATSLTATNGNRAGIVTPDIILANGVMHIIDTVFLNTNVDTAAASSAYQSATSAAGTAPTTTETAPVGVTGTAAGGGGSTGSGTSSPSAGRAVRFELPVAGLLITALGAAVGGLVTLA